MNRDIKLEKLEAGDTVVCVRSNPSKRVIVGNVYEIDKTISATNCIRIKKNEFGKASTHYSHWFKLLTSNKLELLSTLKEDNRTIDL